MSHPSDPPSSQITSLSGLLRTLHLERAADAPPTFLFPHDGLCITRPQPPCFSVLIILCKYLMYYLCVDCSFSSTKVNKSIWSGAYGCYRGWWVVAPTYILQPVRPLAPRLWDSLCHTTVDRDVAQSFSFTFVLAEQMSLLWVCTFWMINESNCKLRIPSFICVHRAFSPFIFLLVIGRNSFRIISRLRVLCLQPRDVLILHCRFYADPADRLTLDAHTVKIGEEWNRLATCYLNMFVR